MSFAIVQGTSVIALGQNGSINGAVPLPEELEGYSLDFLKFDILSSSVILDLEYYKTQQIDAIKEQATHLYRKPVTDTQGIVWRGGMDSATSIKNGIDMAEFLGETEIVLRDVSRNPHTMSMADARVVAATIGAAWQVIFQAEEEALRQLSLIDLNSPTAEQDIAAVQLNNYFPQPEPV